MRTYPYRVGRDGDAYVLDVPDFPEIHSWADTEEDAAGQVLDAIETAFMAAIKTKTPVRSPSEPGEGYLLVTVPTLTTMKADLHNAMLQEGVSKAELARRLNASPVQVDRLLDLRHASRMSQLDAAGEALGWRFHSALRQMTTGSAVQFRLDTDWAALAAALDKSESNVRNQLHSMFTELARATRRADHEVPDGTAARAEELAETT